MLIEKIINSSDSSLRWLPLRNLWRPYHHLLWSCCPSSYSGAQVWNKPEKRKCIKLLPDVIFFHAQSLYGMVLGTGLSLVLRTMEQVGLVVTICLRPLFRPRINHTCHQKPNPSREKVPLTAFLLLFISSLLVHSLYTSSLVPSLSFHLYLFRWSMRPFFWYSPPCSCPESCGPKLPCLRLCST